MALARTSRDETRQLEFDWSEVERARQDPQHIFDTATVETVTALAESDFFDRKSARIDAKTLAVSACAFSNGRAGRGGVIAVGISDDGTPDLATYGGQNKLNELQRDLRVLCPLAEVRSRLLDTPAAQVLLFRVDCVAHRVVEMSDGSVYTRIADTDRRLLPDEIVHLRYDKGEVSFESEVLLDSGPDELDPALVSAFCDAVRTELDLQHDRSWEDVLVQRRLATFEAGRFRPRHSALWLFAKDPMRRFPGCKVRFIRYEGTEERTGAELNVIRDVMIEGAVPILIRDATQAVFAQLREYRALQPDGTFSLVPEYPLDCVREAIVNACAHRSYSMRNSNVFIRMFDNRLEVESPGGFIPPVTAETIYDYHTPRNPLMMDGLRYLKFVRCANEGTRRMRSLMRDLGLPDPMFRESRGPIAQVMVTLNNDIEHRRVWVDRGLDGLVGEQLAKALTQEEKRVLNYLAENGRMTVSDTFRVTTVKTWHTARKIMDGLLNKGLIREVREPKIRDPKAHFVLARAWQTADGSSEPRSPSEKNRR
jgi:ATP-dependent DNA helicase RecG